MFMKKWDYKWQVVASVIFGSFMVIMDATVVNVALPKLRDVFAADVSQIQWVISGFILAVGIVTPLSGFLADRYGIKKIYLTSLACFTLASVFCGIAPNLPLLILGRVLQGVGGGSVLPLGTALLFSAFPPEQRGLAFGIFGIPLVVAPALGPVLGGAFVEYLSWRYIFFINVPVGFLGLLVGWMLLREQKAEGPVPIDIWGALCSTIGFGALLYGIANGAPAGAAGQPGTTATSTSGGWGSWQVIASLTVGAVFLVIFGLLQLRRKDQALLDLRLFKDPVFTIANIIGWITVVGFFGAEFLLPLYLQVLRGLSPLNTGLLLLPLAISSGILVPFVGRWQDKIGARVLVTFGFLLLVVNTWQLSALTFDTSYLYLAFLLVLRGVALAFVLQPTQLAALSVVKLPALPRASSLVNASRSIFQSLGVAVLATILQTVTANRLAGFKFVPDTQTKQQIAQAIAHGAQSRVPSILAHAAQQQAQQAFAHAFLAGLSHAYLATFFVAAAASIIALFLPGWPFQKKQSDQTADGTSANEDTVAADKVSPPIVG